VFEAMVTGESSPMVDQTPKAVPKAGHRAVAGDLPNIHLSYRLDGRLSVIGSIGKDFS